MLKAFIEHIEFKKLFKREDRLLIAISGGIDSVVLAHLLKKSGYHFSMAHCNFSLRKKDSDFDEDFCFQLSRILGVDFYIKHFDVKAYQKKNKVSVQMAARDLRYLWFKELLTEKKLDYLLTAHHGNDVIETTFINFLRGTGVNGLKGIPEKSGQIVRPLLCFTKEEILAYATENKINFRLDKSNFEDKYERNFLRLNIIPAFKKLHPQVEKTILNNVANFKEEAAIVNEYLSDKLKKIVKKKGSIINLDKKMLINEQYRRSVLHFFLNPLGFNASQVDDIVKNLLSNGLVGKILNSPTHVLTIDRQQLVIRENNIAQIEDLKFDSMESLMKYRKILVSTPDRFSIPNKSEIILESRKIVFPISIRSKIKGDKFKPFGMKGFKLLSDFLKEQKLNNFEKESCKLLVNGNGEIIWVIGYRSDDRYRVPSKHAQLIKLTLVE